jgi:hypothetical protein
VGTGGDEQGEGGGLLRRALRERERERERESESKSERERLLGTILCI